jgi:hypothetical protein
MLWRMMLRTSIDRLVVMQLMVVVMMMQLMRMMMSWTSSTTSLNVGITHFFSTLLLNSLPSYSFVLSNQNSLFPQKVGVVLFFKSKGGDFR